jgi:hypothetical protein
MARTLFKQRRSQTKTVPIILLATLGIFTDAKSGSAPSPAGWRQCGWPASTPLPDARMPLQWGYGSDYFYWISARHAFITILKMQLFDPSRSIYDGMSAAKFGDYCRPLNAASNAGAPIIRTGPLAFDLEGPNLQREVCGWSVSPEVTSVCGFFAPDWER